MYMYSAPNGRISATNAGVEAEITTKVKAAGGACQQRKKEVMRTRMEDLANVVGVLPLAVLTNSWLNVRLE
jgi:hypothetical protein